jgi:hypothetical protein
MKEKPFYPFARCAVVKTSPWPDNHTVNSRGILAFLLLAAVLGSAGDTKPGAGVPRATHAKTYPAREVHEDEGVSVAIDPFDMADKAAVFKVKYKDHGFLPVRLIISNDSDKTVMLDDLQVQYITVNRSKLEPADRDALYRRLAHGGNRPDKPGVRLPLPIPKKTKPAVSKETLEEIDSLQFYTYPVTAHSSSSGFLFFDVSGLDTPEAGAHVYISGMKVNGKELFYFDIPLEKYLNYHPGQ